MSKSKRVTGLFAAAVATAALAVPVVASADHPGQTVELKSTITINPYGSAGKVIRGERELRRGAARSSSRRRASARSAPRPPSSTGSWKAEPKYKGNVPFKVYAEVKPVTQGTAGTIYKCLGATSKIRTINGG